MMPNTQPAAGLQASDKQKDNHYFARHCADLGLHVFPCWNCPQDEERHKKPLLKWRDASTTDLKQIARWWSKWPNALPAIDLAKSGHFVVDGDRHPNDDGILEHDGVAALAALFAEHKTNLAVVPTIITPKDGRHYWFLQRDGEPLGNTTKADGESCLPPGVDVRGSGGYVIAPGAQLPDGRRYTRDKTTPNIFEAIRNGTVPVLPLWFLNFVRPNGHTQPATGVPSAAPVADRHLAYARAALAGVGDELARVPKGRRNATLNNAALRMGHMIVNRWIERGEVESQLTSAAMACGLARKEITLTLRSGIEAGMKEPHKELDDRPRSSSFDYGGIGQGPEGLREKPQSTPANLESAAASTFMMRGIRWFWNNRFALGKLGLIGGLPDRGKGLIACYIIAMATTAGLWPCNEGHAIQGNVLLLTAEDDIEDTIIPRLAAAGADLARVHIIKMVRHAEGKRMFSLVTDLELLRQKIKEIVQRG
jgi:Bifunctional DNA primase/polymerase, N-terminal/AAA domain